MAQYSSAHINHGRILFFNKNLFKINKNKSTQFQTANDLIIPRIGEDSYKLNNFSKTPNFISLYCFKTRHTDCSNVPVSTAN